LLLRSAIELASVPLGFNAHNVLVARMSLPAARYAHDAAVSEAYRAILSQLRDIVGVEHAAVATSVPLVGGGPDAAIAVEHVEFASGSAPSPHIRLVSDAYNEAMGVALIRGRAFQPPDLFAGAPSVVLINERLAAALWPGGNPIGKRISTWTSGPEPQWREVVGVVADVRAFGQIEPVPLELFIPYTQAPVGAWNVFQRSMVLVLRTNRDWPETYATPLRAAVSTVDPSVPLYDVRTMEQVVAGVTAARRFYLRLVLLLAATALGLAVLGVYGVIAHLVSQRRSEIGLRMAVGAQRIEVIRFVVAHGLRLALFGVAIGVPAALLQAQVMRNLLFEVPPTDLLTFVSVVLLLTFTSVLASLFPAVKAARVDPLLALRHE
jgi:predicted permease